MPSIYQLLARAIVLILAGFITTFYNANSAFANNKIVLTGEGIVSEHNKPGALFKMRYVHTDTINKETGQELAELTTVSHLSLEGRELVSENAQYDKGLLKSYRVEQRQRNLEATIKVEGSKVHFWKKEKNKIETTVDDASENLVVGPTLFAYFKLHSAELEAGRILPVRFAIFDLMKTIAFDVQKVENNCTQNEADLCLEMKVSSLLLRPLVKSSYFSFKRTEGQLAVNGVIARAVLHKQIADTLEPFIGKIDYQSPSVKR